MTSVRWTRAEAEQAAARALWQAGNDRIGFREWDTVKDHYLLEAGMALDALGITDTFTVTDGHLEQVGSRCEGGKCGSEGPHYYEEPNPAGPLCRSEPVYRVVPS